MTTGYGSSGPLLSQSSVSGSGMMTTPTIDQATAQDAAVSAPLQSVLDTLAGTLDTTASQSAAALQLVTNTLRNSAKQAGQTNQAGINAALNAVGQAVATNSTLNEAVLNNIVSAIAGVPASPNPAYLPALMPPTPPRKPPTDTGGLSGQFAAGSAIPNCPPGQAYNPNTGQCYTPYCPPGMVWDSQFSQCVPSGYQNPTGCTPPQVQVPGSNPPQCYLPPQPPQPPPPPPGGPNPPPPPNIPPPGGPNPPPPPVMPPPVMPPPPLPPALGCQFAPPGGTGNCNPGQLPTNLVGSPPAVGPCDYNGGYPYDCPGGAEYVAPDGSIHYVAYYFPSAVAMSPPPLPPQPPPLPPPPPAPPTCPPAPPCPASPPPPPTPQPTTACTVPQLPPVTPGAIPSMGSTEWCGAINLLMTDLGSIGTMITALPGLADPGSLNVQTSLPSSLENFFTGIVTTINNANPGGINPILNVLANTVVNVRNFVAAVWYWVFCIWNKVTGELRALIIAAYRTFMAITCGNPSITVSLIIFRSAVRAFSHARVGVNAAMWATVDISIEWDQVDAAIEYLIKYSCPYIIPGHMETMNLYRGGWIPQTIYECWMKMNGCDPQIWAQPLEAGRPRPGLGERQMMLWRLREGAPGITNTYSDSQYQADLKLDGYNQARVDELMQIRYHVYAIRELRMLMDAGVLHQSDAVNAFLDQGFPQDKATVLGQMEQILTLRRREQEVQGKTPAHMAQWLTAGVYTNDMVRSGMTALGYSDPQASDMIASVGLDAAAKQALKFITMSENEIVAGLRQGYRDGLMDAESVSASLQSWGCPAQTATALLGAWDGEERIAATKSVVASIKKGFNSGLLSNLNASISLGQAGVSNVRATNLLNQWQLEMDVSRKTETASMILNDVATGIETGEMATIRLHNMGWNDADAQVLISESMAKLQQSITSLEAKQLAAAEREAKAIATQTRQAQAAAARAQAQAAAAAEKLARQTLTAQKAARDVLLKATPISVLNRLLKEGNISREAYVTRMILLGYEEASAQLQADDTCSGKTAACVPTAGADDATLAGLPS